MEDRFLQDLKIIVSIDKIKIKERMEYHTSLHIGGEADYMVTPSSSEEVKAVIALCRRYEIPFYVMGNGSNLLVSDTGYRGLILKLDESFSEITIRDNGIVTAQAGVLLSRLSSVIAKESLTGFEFAAGIPGTLGGAVAMNAGAYDGEMKFCLISATLMDYEGNVREFSNAELELSYRSSILQKSNYIVLDATLQLKKGDQEAIYSRIKELNGLRREKQPLDQYSAGSTFKRPSGYFAAKLISDSELSGYRVGGAEVSTKHCGFLINKDKATAEDFLGLMKEVTGIVEEKFGVTLEPEVKYLGF